MPNVEKPTDQASSTSTAYPPAAIATTKVPSSDTQAEQEYYPPPTSSYYFGAPDASRAFGEPQTGTPGLHLPKEIVRIERDYSLGELPQYHPSFPLELETRLSPTTFSEIVNDINSLLVEAHNSTRVWVDNVVAIGTFYLSTLVLGTHYRRTMKKLDELVERVNRETMHPAGLNLVHPHRTAFLFLEVEYF
ncbi:Golgin subfamily A member 7/ERF4 [Kalmanozyma brasiliensis GHG001]|nr:Golgin subfamily A member 7/ERF4 [Kalmanozyma brasiliensis GHG001]KAF6767089.1 Golgin subfamily A member 7/ERF4 [Kalmanozyma brasiliensis GHG001]